MLALAKVIDKTAMKYDVDVAVRALSVSILRT